MIGDMPWGTGYRSVQFGLVSLDDSYVGHTYYVVSKFFGQPDDDLHTGSETCSCVLYIATNGNIVVFMTVCMYRYTHTRVLYNFYAFFLIFCFMWNFSSVSRCFPLCVVNITSTRYFIWPKEWPWFIRFVIGMAHHQLHPVAKLYFQFATHTLGSEQDTRCRVTRKSSKHRN